MNPYMMTPGVWIIWLLGLVSLAALLHCAWRAYKFLGKTYLWRFPGNTVLSDGVDVQVWKDGSMWYARIPIMPSCVVLCLTKDEAIRKVKEKLKQSQAQQDASRVPTVRIVG